MTINTPISTRQDGFETVKWKSKSKQQRDIDAIFDKFTIMKSRRPIIQRQKERIHHVGEPERTE